MVQGSVHDALTVSLARAVCPDLHPRQALLPRLQPLPDPPFVEPSPPPAFALLSNEPPPLLRPVCRQLSQAAFVEQAASDPQVLGRYSVGRVELSRQVWAGAVSVSLPRYLQVPVDVEERCRAMTTMIRQGRLR